MPRKKKIPDPPEVTEYKKKLQAFHKRSNRHVLTIEADLTEDEKRHIFHEADRLRQCGNELTGIMKKRLEQLFRTKRYRNLQRLYGKYSENGDDSAKKCISDQMNEMQKQYLVTWDACQDTMKAINDKYGIPSVFALTRAEDIWSAVEKVLYGGGKNLHFHKRGEFPAIRAKQMNKSIILKMKDGRLWFSCMGFDFTYKDGDRFISDELSAVMSYLKNPDVNDGQAVRAFIKDGCLTDTYRPCYVSLVCKTIRGKLRVYIYLTIEGRAVPKYDRAENIRHIYGKGRVGCDIGTQTYAYTSETEVGLSNLAERGSSIRQNERQERLILRKMDRSRRATNPDNYNADGTIRKGPKVWHYSKNYRKLKARHEELCRKASENRRLAINEDVNHLRELGDELITEQKNFKALQRRTKSKSEEAANGSTEGMTISASKKNKRRKRFGRSLRNRCPGYMHERLKKKFIATGGAFREVPNNYRASQYDHTSGEFVKKELSQRIFHLADGTRVQRDCYSSFLLFCADTACEQIDGGLCQSEFQSVYKKQVALINEIACSGAKICNSGIRGAWKHI